MTTFQAASIIPAYEPLGMSLGTTIQGASYLTSAQIVVLGVAPLFWKPLSHRIGRQPVWLISTICSGLFNIGCALSPTYGAMMVCRCFGAFFIAPPIAIGSGVVVETFFPAQRGQKMGIWTYGCPCTYRAIKANNVQATSHLRSTRRTVYLLIHNSVCGLALDILGSRNCLFSPPRRWTVAYTLQINFVQFGAYLIFGSETRFLRSKEPQTANTPKPTISLFKRIDPEPVTMAEIIDPIIIGRYLTVLLPAISYTIVFCFASVLLTVEIPQTFIPTFGLDPQELGLNFIALIIG